MNFASLIHGDLGAIVCDSLLLHELSALTRVSHSTHQLVEYKYSHMKHLNLGAYSNISLQNFGLMCARLRGIEVLLVPLNHSMIVTSQSDPDPSAPNSTWEATGYVRTGVVTNFRGLNELFSLMYENSNTMRVFRLHRVVGTTGDAIADANMTLLGTGYHALILADFFTYCIDTRAWRRLEVVELLHPVDLTKWSMTEAADRHHHVLTPASIIEAAAVVAVAEAEAMVEAVDGQNQVSDDPTELSIKRLAEVFSSQRVLEHHQSIDDEKVNGSTNINSNTTRSKISTISTSSANSNSTESTLLKLRVAPFSGYLTRVELTRWVAAMPHLEAFNLAFSEEEESEGAFHIQSPSTTSTTRNSDSLPSSTLHLTHLVSDHIVCIPLWSNLLALRIMSFLGFASRRVELRLPQLMHLTIHDSSLWDHKIQDLSFDCPRLIALRVCMTCRASGEVKSMLDSKAALISGPTISFPTIEPDGGVVGQEEEEVMFLATPPSLYTSMRGSPHIRNFNCLRLNTQAIRMDYSHFLTQDEKQKIHEKAKSLGYAQLEEEDDESEDRRVYRTRLFYYALSLLPCVETLEMIEFAPEHISLDEYLSLFPHLRAVSRVRLWIGTPVWYRPPEDEDESHFLYQQRRIVKEYSQRANRMHQQKDTCQLTERNHSHVAIFNLCSSEMTLTLTTTKRMSTTPLLTQLRSLFLSAPTVIESSQVISQLFLSCRQLEHASLMQLDGSIDNTVFTQLPADCVRSSLVTLRIKTPCGVEPSKTFNEQLLTRELLPRLFPRLSHFEYLLIYRLDEESDDSSLSFVTECLDRLTAILSPLSDSASSSASSSSTTDRLLWPSLSYLSVRVPHTRDDKYNLDLLSPLGPLALTFASRFMHIIDGNSTTHTSGLLPTLAYFLAHRNPLLNSDEDYWNLPQRFGPTALPDCANSSLRTILVSESTCFRAHCRYHTHLAEQAMEAELEAQVDAEVEVVAPAQVENPVEEFEEIATMS